MSQDAAIPLVLGLGATFIILMGSIDLSVEGVLTLSAVILSMLVLNGMNGNDLGIVGVLIVLLVGAIVGLINGLIHVWLRVPSFMATLGSWFIGVGAANALLGGMATRINDPWIRGLAIKRVLGFPWGVWLALSCLAVAFVIQNYTRLGRHVYALGGGEELAALSGISVAGSASPFSLIAGVFYAIGGILAAAQLGLGNAQIGMGASSPPLPPSLSGEPRYLADKAECCRPLSASSLSSSCRMAWCSWACRPSVQIGLQGLMIIAAVALSIDRKLTRIVK